MIIKLSGRKKIFTFGVNLTGIMLKKIITAAFSFLVLHSSAQTIFFKTYGGANKEEGKCLALCSDGGFIIGADVTLIPPAPDSSNVLIVRTNSFGDTLWTRIFNSGENDFCVKVIQTSDLGFAVLANRMSASAISTSMLIKLSQSGNIQWQKSYSDSADGLKGYSFIENVQGGYFIVGACIYFPSYVHQGKIIKTNSSGDTLWTKEVTESLGALFLEFHDIKQLSDSSLVLLGSHQQLDEYAIHVSKMDVSGNFIYSKEHRYGLDDVYSTTIIETMEGNNFLIAGASGDWIPSHRFFIKINSLLDTIWTQGFNIPMNEIYNVIQLPDSGFVFLAEQYNSPNSHQYYMVKTNSNGVISWAKEFQYGSLHNQHSLHLTQDNGIAFCGYSIDTLFNNNKDLLFIKTDLNGNLPCDGTPVNITHISYPFFYTIAFSYEISAGVSSVPSNLTVQGGIPASNLCISTVAENSLEGGSDLQIFPNPATNQIEVRNPKSEIRNIEIYNIMGKKIFSEPETSNQKLVTLDVSNLSPGIYFVRFVGEKEQAIRKVVVQR